MVKELVVIIHNQQYSSRLRLLNRSASIRLCS